MRFALAILVGVALVVVASLAAHAIDRVLPASIQPAPVTATLAGDGARITWPGAGCAWHGSALLGCGVGGVRPGRDAANQLRPGDLVVVRSLEGREVGRARVRGLWYLPSIAKPPPR